MATLPEGVGLGVSAGRTEQPSKTFIIDWSAQQVSGMGSGLEAMQQAVDIILHTERFRWQIYSSGFGRELDGLVGEEYGYIVGDLPRRVEEALLADSRVLSVENFRFSDPGGSSVTCSFDVVTVFGAFGKEVAL